MKETLKVSTSDLGKEIIIRHGDAPKVNDPMKCEIEGTLGSVVEFLTKRESTLDKDKVHILYSIDKGTIAVDCDENNELGTHVTGKLVLDKKIDTLYINQNKTYSLKELVQKLRFSKPLFADEVEHKRIVDALMKFNASVSTSVKKENDLKGNIDEQFVQRVNTTSDLTFTVKARIYKGMPAKTFKVETFCEIRSAQVEFWFESIELSDLIESEKETAVLAEVEKLKDKYVCIEI